MRYGPSKTESIDTQNVNYQCLDGKAISSSLSRQDRAKNNFGVCTTNPTGLPGGYFGFSLLAAGPKTTISVLARSAASGGKTSEDERAF
jgi:hypothetical protein